MQKESISYARKNENIWTTLAVIAANVEVLEGNERELDLAFKAQDENDPGGYVDQKNQLFTAYFRKIYKLGRKLSFYAKETGNKVLLNDVDVAESTVSMRPTTGSFPNYFVRKLVDSRVFILYIRFDRILFDQFPVSRKQLA